LSCIAMFQLDVVPAERLERINVLLCCSRLGLDSVRYLSRISTTSSLTCTRAKVRLLLSLSPLSLAPLADDLAAARSFAAFGQSSGLGQDAVQEVRARTLLLSASPACPRTARFVLLSLFVASLSTLASTTQLRRPGCSRVSPRSSHSQFAPWLTLPLSLRPSPPRRLPHLLVHLPPRPSLHPARRIHDEQVHDRRLQGKPQRYHRAARRRFSANDHALGGGGAGWRAGGHQCVSFSCCDRSRD